MVTCDHPPYIPVFTKTTLFLEALPMMLPPARYLPSPATPLPVWPRRRRLRGAQFPCGFPVGVSPPSHAQPNKIATYLPKLRHTSSPRAREATLLEAVYSPHTP